MFGYININQPEIKFKDFYKFRSYYCGLCSGLKRKYGNISRISLGYDMTFLSVLLSGLYDSETEAAEFRCIAHPLRKRVKRVNEFTEYAADMNLLLVYYKCIDDWQDQRRISRLLYSRLISSKVKKIFLRYPDKVKKIQTFLSEQSLIEKDKDSALESAAGCFGHVLAEVFAYKQDKWEHELRRMGFFLGKFIYFLDAYDDVFKDAENNCYNPFFDMVKEDDFNERAEEILRVMISESASAFEMLPIDENMDILRNIIYSGVWSRFEAIQTERKTDKMKGTD